MKKYIPLNSFFVLLVCLVIVVPKPEPVLGLQLDLDRPLPNQTKIASEEEAKEPLKLPSAEQIIEKYISAIGGYELLESRKTVHYRARAVKSNEAFDYEVYIAEGRYHASYQYESGRVFKRGIVDDVAWTQTNGSTRRLEGEELKGLLSRHEHLVMSTKWLDICRSIKVLGKKRVGDAITYHVRFVDHEGFKKDRFFDTETGLILRSEAEEVYRTETRHIIREYSDFFQSGDAFIPRVRKVTSKRRSSTVHYVYTVKSYDVDVKIPKGTFDLPKTIAADVAKQKKAKSLPLKKD